MKRGRLDGGDGSRQQRLRSQPQQPPPPPPITARCGGGGSCLQRWAAGERVVAPNPGGREFTLITRHRLPDGSSAPFESPEAVRTALERLGLTLLISTIVSNPAASAPTVPLEVADLGPKGCGVLARRDVAMGEAVCDYVGEILSTQDAAARQSVYDAALRLPDPREGRRGMNYLLVLLEHLPTRTVRTSVDPTHIGGVASCINHACIPNLRPEVVRDRSVVPTVRLVAAVPIAEGTELTFDYDDLYSSRPNNPNPNPNLNPPTGADRDHGHDDGSHSQPQKASTEDGASSSSSGGGGGGGGGVRSPCEAKQQDKAGNALTPCLCGAEQCRGYLPFSTFSSTRANAT